MISILIASAFSFVITIFATPLAIRVLREREIGQFIQEEVEGHYHKRGTPTMGGIVMIVAVIIGYLVSHIRFWEFGEGFVFRVVGFPGQGWLRPLYFTILISHAVLAAVVLPLVVITVAFALRGRIERHRRIARWTLPLWFYVSVTGVMIYAMLYHLPV